jgi:hypothetical protein
MTILTLGNPIHEWIQQHGRAWGPCVPIARGAPAPGTCFANALELSICDPKLDYCEGYAYAPKMNLPFHHGWVVNDTGEVLDPRWPDGAGYFGVRFGRGYVQRRMLAMMAKCTLGSLLDARNTDRDYGLLDGTELRWMR